MKPARSCLTESVQDSTLFQRSIAQQTFECPLGEYSQSDMLGQCPYCGRVNYVPLHYTGQIAPDARYTTLPSPRPPHVGQIVRHYIPGSTSRTCPKCARRAMLAWLLQREA